MTDGNKESVEARAREMLAVELEREDFGEQAFAVLQLEEGRDLDVDWECAVRAIAKALTPPTRENAEGVREAVKTVLGQIPTGEPFQVGDKLGCAALTMDQVEYYTDAILRLTLVGEQVKLALSPEAFERAPKHHYWCAGEPDCPCDIKAPNGELHTLRCKICELDNPRNPICHADALFDRATLSLPTQPVSDGGKLASEWQDLQALTHDMLVEDGSEALKRSLYQALVEGANPAILSDIVTFSARMAERIYAVQDEPTQPVNQDAVEAAVWGPIDVVDNALGALSEALFVLSDRLRSSGFLEVGEQHQKYEDVVREYHELRTAIRALNTSAATQSPAIGLDQATVERCAQVAETVPIGGGTLSSWVNTNESPMGATRRHIAAAIRALTPRGQS